MKRENAVENKCVFTSSKRYRPLPPIAFSMGETRCNTFSETSDKRTLLHSEEEEEEGLCGVALMLFRDAAESLIEWESVCDRFITASFELRF